MTQSDEYIMKHPVSHIMGIVSSAFMILLVYFFLAYSVNITINCTKTNTNKGSCSFVKDHLIFQDKQNFDISSIDKMRAEFVEKRTDDDIQLFLDLKAPEKTEIEVLNNFSIDIPEGRFKLAENFNNFLIDPSQKEFLRTYDNRKVPFICSGILVLFGIWGIVYSGMALLKKL